MEMRSPTDGFAELTLETDDLAGLERFYVEAFGLAVLAREEDRVWLAAGPHARLGLWSPGRKEFGDRGPEEHAGGDRSIYVEDPAGNIVEVWDFFARRPIDALAE
jgi:catechol-2,3-dioxygenase